MAEGVSLILVNAEKCLAIRGLTGIIMIKFSIYCTTMSSSVEYHGLYWLSDKGGRTNYWNDLEPVLDELKTHLIRFPPMVSSVRSMAAALRLGTPLVMYEDFATGVSMRGESCLPNRFNPEITFAIHCTFP